MQRTDTPRLQVFRQEMAKVEGVNDGRLAVDSGRHHMAILLRAVCPSFLVGKQHSLVQTGLINSLADWTERIESPLAPLTFVKEVPDSLFK